MRLSSIGYLEGFYYKPRIDKEVLEKYSQGLIVLSSCIKGEIPFKAIKGDYNGAVKAAEYYKDLFGENFYLELQNHGLNEEQIRNSWQKDLSIFKRIRKKYLLYPDFE